MRWSGFLFAVDLRLLAPLPARCRLPVLVLVRFITGHAASGQRVKTVGRDGGYGIRVLRCPLPEAAAQAGHAFLCWGLFQRWDGGRDGWGSSNLAFVYFNP